MLIQALTDFIQTIQTATDIPFLLNDLHHQSASITPHETLPGIFARLDFYKQIALSREQIIELQTLGTKYGLTHPFIREPAGGIISKKMTEHFIDALKDSIKENIHRKVQEKLTTLVPGGSTAAALNPIEEERNRFISDCLELFPSLTFAETPTPEEKFKAIMTFVKRELEKTSVDEGLKDNLEKLQELCQKYRQELNNHPKEDFVPLISGKEVPETIVYQVATAIETLPELIRQARLKQGSNNAEVTPAPTTQARGLTANSLQGLTQDERLLKGLLKSLITQYNSALTKENEPVYVSCSNPANAENFKNAWAIMQTKSEQEMTTLLGIVKREIAACQPPDRRLEGMSFDSIAELKAKIQLKQAAAPIASL